MSQSGYRVPTVNTFALDLWLFMNNLTKNPTDLKGVVPILTYLFQTTNWLTLTPRYSLHSFTPGLLFIFSPGAKTSIWHWWWGWYENNKQNQNWYTENRNIFLIQLPKYSEFEHRHLTPKKYFLRLSLGGWECDRHITRAINDH